VLCAVCWLVIGCAAALKEPPSLEELAAQSPNAGEASVDELLARADSLYGQRTLDAARAAVELYLQASAADSARNEGLVGAARAQIWIANHAPDAESRTEAAVGAVHAGQWCQRVRPQDAACDFWLAGALGVQARERRSTGKDALSRIVALLERAVATDPELEHAGPHRVLALLLLRAPGWPVGPGDAERGLEHARIAVELRPDYPPNQLCLGEALRENGDTEGSLKAYTRAERLARPLAATGRVEAEEWVEEARTAISSAAIR
jgi:tetratricopeptide (TPR) repeat protein